MDSREVRRSLLRVLCTRAPLVPEVGVRRRRGGAGPSLVSRRRHAAGRILGHVGSLLLVIAVGACSDATAGDVGFAGSAPSLEALGRGVLDAVPVGDTMRLNSFRLTEHEHNEEVWPELPASAPEVNLPVDYVWEDIQRRNARALTRLLPSMEGRRLSFVDVQCRGPVRSFTTFRVLTDCWVVFDNPDEAGAGPVAPRRYEMQLFKDVLVRDGGHKIFRYYEDPPRPTTTGRTP